MFDPIETAIAAIRDGKMIVVVDDEDRENEGDLVMAATHATPQAVNFMAQYGRGLICVPMPAARAVALRLPSMVPGHEGDRCHFAVSVDYQYGTTTGISASDRAKTIQALANESSLPEDFHRPGHVFPLIARAGGVLTRPGHTEASLDFVRLAGIKSEASVICEISRHDGEMARRDELRLFAKDHGLPFVSIKDLIAYRVRHDKLMTRAATAMLPTAYGTFQIHVYASDVDNKEHVALVMGDVADGEGVLTRLHSECLTGDVFHSLRCDCRDQLEVAMKQVAATGKGIILYLRQEGRGIGLANKIRAYALQQNDGLDTVEANVKLGFPEDDRHYWMAAQMLGDLGVKSIELMTNNPAKVSALSGLGVTISAQVSLETPSNPFNEGYLKVKKEKMGHTFKNF